MRFGLRHGLFGIWVACCLLALIWPGYAWLGNRIEPRVLGVPFSLAWVVGWVLGSFLALGAYHASGRAGRRRRGE